VNFDEAVRAVTGEGQAYEIVQAEVDGQLFEVFRNTPPSLRSIFDILRTKTNETFLVYEDEQWSFSKVTNSIDSLSRYLTEDLNIGRGDRVALAMRNLPEWIVSYAAVLSVGAVAVLFNAWWQRDELDFAIADSEPSLIIADEERYVRLASTAQRRDLPVVTVRSDPTLPCVRLEEILVVPGQAVKSPIDLDDDATILYTSGTTGHPKGAVSTHRAVLSAVMAFGARNEVQKLLQPSTTAPKDPPCFILAIPLFHVTGSVAVLLGAIATTSKLVLLHHWDPGRALEMIETHRVTNFIGVPTMSWDLMEAPSFTSTDTSSLVSIGGGGSPVPPQLVTRLDQRVKSAAPSFGYGMTETNAYGPGIGGKDLLDHPTSAGKTIPIMEYTIVSPLGENLPVGESGEICFRGVNLIRGYWRRPDAYDPALTHGWLKTGDLGHIDEDGYLYIEDRIKDMIIRGGENVYSVEVEAVLYEHPAVNEAAVFGVPHERLGEEVVAAVQLRTDQACSEAELREFVGQHLAGFKVPTRIYITPDPLPRGATGKIVKRELKSTYTS
jgi:long-chain acyl-CoA synthetase